MRRVGGELTKENAERFANYLYVEGISVSVEEGGHVDGRALYDIWVRDEDRLAEARQHLESFRQSPADTKYDVRGEAEALRRQQAQEQRERVRLQRSYSPRGGAGPSFSMPAPVTKGIIAICIVASLLTAFGSFRRLSTVGPGRRIPVSIKAMNLLSFVPMFEEDPDTGEIVDGNENPMHYIAKGQVWRLVTPIFLHGSPMHLLFNCLIIFSFGRVIEGLFGSGFFAAIFLIGGVIGNLAQAFGPEFLGASPHVIGASGGALALFVYVWLRPMLEPTLPIRVPPMQVLFVLGWVVIAMLPISPIPSVANLAHLGGIAVGAIAAIGAFDFLRR